MGQSLLLVGGIQVVVVVRGSVLPRHERGARLRRVETRQQALSEGVLLFNKEAAIGTQGEAAPDVVLVGGDRGISKSLIWVSEQDTVVAE